MDTKEAVVKRILALCEEQHIAVNKLANLAGMPPMTVYSMLNFKSKNPGIVNIRKLCDGLGITLRQFFNVTEFDNLDEEIDWKGGSTADCRVFIILI